MRIPFSLSLILFTLYSCSCGERNGSERDYEVDTIIDISAEVDATTDISAEVDATTDNQFEPPSDMPVDGEPCEEGNVCQNDRRCAGGVCIPWEDNEFDPECVRRAEPGPIRPQLQCWWEGPPEGDPYPDYNHVLHTPLVADLNISLGSDVPSRPSIIFISDHTYSEGGSRICQAAGILRIIDGATCRELGAATAEDERVNSSVTPAVGDIDGDTVVEIVAAAAEGGIIAFKWDETVERPVSIWKSKFADGTDDLYGSDSCLWGGVTITDLNDDGAGEIIFDGAVWSHEGTRLSAAVGWIGYRWGVPAPVADVDLDTIPELVAAEGVWQWDSALNTFVSESYFTGEGATGFTAIADFGEFPGHAGDGAETPEIVVSGNSMLLVESIGGDVISSITSPSRGGGPPTIADYDGDTLPEIGAAFADDYIVWDFIDGRILWDQPSQDHSSAKTGSSVFDFNGDGQAEVVYGDECYVRIYDGRTGEVLFSQARFSSTWEENPVVADVDGDYAAEIVMGMSGVCRPEYCDEWDPLFKGLQCDSEDDCPAGPCVEGLCRCETDDQCGYTYGCTNPLPATPGEGKVCRARHLDCRPGIRVYRDARDRWASSRKIWNQHAYFVTNINEDGTIPKTSEMENNWQVDTLNNFRQNVQGELMELPGPDFTVKDLEAVCEGDQTRIVALVCNRGGALIDSGVTVIFMKVGGEELCRLTTPEPVPPGKCYEVSCIADVQAEGQFMAVADPDDAIIECIENNNLAFGEADCLL